MASFSSRRRPALTALALTSLTLAACGGGGGSSHPAGPAQPVTPLGGQPQVSTTVTPAVAHRAAAQAKKLPPAVVAIVAGQQVTRSQWHQAYLQQAGDALTPARCIADLRATYARGAQTRHKAEQAMLARAAKGGPKAERMLKAQLARSDKVTGQLTHLSDAKLRAQCAARKKAATTSAMTQLLNALAIRAEARAEHIAVTPGELNAALAAQRRRLGHFIQTAGLAQYLRQNGMTLAAFRHRLELQLIQQKVQARRLSAPVLVSDAQVSAYFKAHAAAFALPERREVELVLTTSKAKARAAAKLLAAGRTPHGAQATMLTKFGADPALAAAVFAAKPRAVIGPVRGTQGWSVARLMTILPAVKPTLASTSARIRQLLAAQIRARRSAAAIAAFTRRWKARVVCRPGYVVSLCANAPSAH